MASCVGFVGSYDYAKVRLPSWARNGPLSSAPAVFGLGLIFITFMGAKSGLFYVLGMAVTSFGSYTYTPFLVTMYLDCGEYYLWKTGKDTRSIAMGLASPPMKIGMALGGTIGLYLLGATGYVAGFTPTAAWIEEFMVVTFMVPGIYLLRSSFDYGHDVQDHHRRRHQVRSGEPGADERCQIKNFLLINESPAFHWKAGRCCAYELFDIVVDDGGNPFHVLVGSSTGAGAW